jgi:hypothetical protein
MSILVQESLDSLRNARNKLYEIAAYELKGWSLDDQEKYANNLHRITKRIIDIEAVKLAEINKKCGNELKEVTAKLDKFIEKESNLLLAVRSINNLLGALDEVVGLIKT